MLATYSVSCDHKYIDRSINPGDAILLIFISWQYKNINITQFLTQF